MSTPTILRHVPAGGLLSNTALCGADTSSAHLTQPDGLLHMTAFVAEVTCEGCLDGIAEVEGR